MKAIKLQNNELVGLREEQKEHDENLVAAREDQAKARSEVSKRERRIKKQEKALEAKVIVHYEVARCREADICLALTATEYGRLRGSDCTLRAKDEIRYGSR